MTYQLRFIIQNPKELVMEQALLFEVSSDTAPNLHPVHAIFGIRLVRWNETLAFQLYFIKKFLTIWYWKQAGQRTLSLNGKRLTWQKVKEDGILKECCIQEKEAKG